MRLAGSSTACLAAALIMVLVRGADDWSQAFAFTWYGLLAIAVVLAVVALAVAGRSRDVAGKRRLAIVGLSLPALLAVPLLVWAVLALAALAD
jgi:hypothetical protein